jgi:hypothetical protein
MLGWRAEPRPAKAEARHRREFALALGPQRQWKNVGQDGQKGGKGRKDGRAGTFRSLIVVLTWLLLPALIVALNVIGASPALAQVRVATLDELRRELRSGDFISVVQTTGDSVRGRLRRFGDADLDIQTETQQAPGQQRRLLDVTIPHGAIRSLERPRDSSRNGALIGAGVGGGVVLAMFVWAFSVDRNEIDEWGPSYLAAGGLYTGIGALAGWAIDRAHSRPHVRFEGPATGPLTIRAGPLLSRRPGMALVVSF